MAVPEEIAWLTTQVLFLATWFLIGGATVWLLAAARRTPRELLQLRVFRLHDRLFGALLALGTGSFAGLMAPAPSLLGFAPPLYWVVGWTAAWAVSVGHGMVTLVRVFRVPRRGSLPSPSAADP